MLKSPGNRILESPENGNAIRTQIWELFILIYVTAYLYYSSLKNWMISASYPDLFPICGAWVGID